MKYNLLVMSLILSACSTVELSDAGKKIHIIKQFSPSDLEVYEPLGEVTCNSGFNGRNSANNIVKCRTELKNKAAELGAEIVVVEHEQMGRGGNAFVANNGFSNGWGSGTAMVGTAYRKKPLL